jgi:adenine phosphoribosyltransferase
MDFYELNLLGVKRRLPIVSISPKVKIASVNLLGDRVFVEKISKEIKKMLEKVSFDYLVGPEVKVVPVLQELSRLLKKDRYVVCRKSIHGYMVSPVKSKTKEPLVINGEDVVILKGSRVVILDDVTTTGNTIRTVESLVVGAGATVVKEIAIFTQGEAKTYFGKNFLSLANLPIFDSH